MIKAVRIPDEPSGGRGRPAPGWWSTAPALKIPPAALEGIRFLHERAAGERLLLTSAGKEGGAGSFVHWAQQCATKPPMIVVAFPRGLRVSRVIYESRAFALCRIEAGDSLLGHRFDESADHRMDPFLDLGGRTGPAGSPVPRRVTSWIECQIAFNLDLEADYGLYVGRVVACGP